MVTGSPICIHAESGIAKTERERCCGVGGQEEQAKQPNQLSELVLLHKEAVSNQSRERSNLEKVEFDLKSSNVNMNPLRQLLVFV